MGADLINDNGRYQGDSYGSVASTLAEFFYRRKDGNSALSTPGLVRIKEEKKKITRC